MIKTVNKRVACKPLELRKPVSLSSLGTLTEKNMLETEVVFSNENGTYQPGDKVFLSKDFEHNDHASWLKIVHSLRGISCILIPEEMIVAHESVNYYNHDQMQKVSLKNTGTGNITWDIQKCSKSEF